MDWSSVMSVKRPLNQFSSDRPIESKAGDLLGRTSFAESLADIVEGWLGNDSLVMALWGPWGIGKSSIKNMVVEHLRRNTAYAATIVQFTPWQWAAQDQISEAFFREIALALGKKDEAKKAKNRAARFAAYAAYLKVGNHLASGVRPLVATSLALAGFFGIGSSVHWPFWLRTFGTVIGSVALMLAALVAWSADFAEKAAAAFSSLHDVKKKDLEELKREVSSLLRNLKSPILVIIDDIDRLTAHQIRLVFQLIKANADFPNLVYLTLFQRDIVEESLDEETSATSRRGKDFLEKIVQVGFDVPQIERSKLHRVLFARLDDALTDESFSKNFDQQRWAQLFISGLAPYFETLRDVYRFLGVLDVQISRMSTRETFEVNPIDLIALEVLRVFEPTVYHILPQFKERLTKSYDFRSGKPDPDRVNDANLNSIIEQSKPGNSPAVEAIIKQIFPRLSSGNEERYYRQLRVCHPDVFDRYFLLSIPEGDISQVDLDTLLASTGDRNRLVSHFNELKKRGLLAVVLDRLEAYKQQVSLDNAVPFITALFDIGDDLPEEHQSGGFNITTWMHASRIVRWYLMTESDIKKRHLCLADAIGLTNGLYLPAMTIALENDSKREGTISSERLLDDAALDDLTALCLKKIRKTVNDGVLSGHPKFGEVLRLWLEWAGPQEPRAWIENYTQSSAGLIAFLEVMARRATVSDSAHYGSRDVWYLRLSEVERFIDPDVVVERVKKLEPRPQNEAQVRALRVFEDALERRRTGKSDEMPF
jgi:predicted KAP-like P-loop ATPase